MRKNQASEYPSEYQAYHDAKQRCTNPKARRFCDYGARGIAFCFESFNQFINHIGPKPKPGMSLERINNSLGYQIGNVKWASTVEQARNRRPYPKTQNRKPSKMMLHLINRAKELKQSGHEHLAKIAVNLTDALQSLPINSTS